MTEHPIIFNGAMVRAILGGAKVETRRVMKPQPEPVPPDYIARGWEPPGSYRWACAAVMSYVNMDMAACSSPYGLRGDELWVRETWKTRGNAFTLKYGALMSYRADGGEAWQTPKRPTGTWRGLDDATFREWLTGKCMKWQPSIHMPRWVSRIQLRVIEVAVQRLHDITDDGARAEGVMTLGDKLMQDAARLAAYEKRDRCTARDYFRQLWQQINGKGDFGWATNPWVWVVRYKMLRPGGC